MVLFLSNTQFEMRLFLTLLTLCSFFLVSSVQVKAQNQSLIVKKTSSPIIIDGLLEEAIWSKTEKASNFSQYFPQDSIPAISDTEIHLAYDEEHLYVGIKCFTKGNDYSIESLRRDYSFWGFDNISILFDTYADQTNALMFGINPLGVQREAFISEGGRVRSGFDSSWDNKWIGEAQTVEGMWTAEMKIPFSTLRFKKGSKKWGMVVYRFDSQNNEISNWIALPRNRVIMDLSYSGDVVWEQELNGTSNNISIIPYASGSLSRDFEDLDQTTHLLKGSAGVDAKIGLTEALNLDITINPDFSQVEVDRQVTNLDRFEISFPERRQFFVENADLFSGFGSRRANPFFSRRIGIALDTSTDINVQNTIYYGMRLSGKLNDRLRVGLLNTQTASQVENDLPSFNYTVAAVEQNVSKRSNIGAIFVNKQAFNTEDFSGTFNNYNRNYGLEYRHVSLDNKWRGKIGFHRVDSPDDSKNKNSHMLQMVYDVRKFRLEWVHHMTGAGYNPEVGFVLRNDILLFSPEASINFYPKNSKITRHRVGLDLTWFYKLGQDDNIYFPEFSQVEKNAEVFWNLDFRNSAMLSLNLKYEDINLLEDFDPTRVQDDQIFLEGGSRYEFGSISLNYRSDRRKVFSYRIEPIFGSFYNGSRYGIRGALKYRFQPYGAIELNYNYNHIDLDAPFKTVDLWLVGPRVDLTLTKKIFFTTFLQYNNQSDNINVNARFQWRFKPVSDFFIVYSENYISDPLDQLESRNRALVIKLTYWLNL